MRAVLFANATATTRLGRRRRSPITHGSALVAFERSRLALAPLERDQRPTEAPGFSRLRRIDRLCHHASLLSRKLQSWLGSLGRRGHALVILLPVHHRPGDARRLVR